MASDLRESGAQITGTALRFSPTVDVEAVCCRGLIKSASAVAVCSLSAASLLNNLTGVDDKFLAIFSHLNSCSYHGLGSFVLHLGFCAASVRCRVRPVRKAENGKNNQRFFAGKKERENITIHRWGTVYGMDVMLFFPENINRIQWKLKIASMPLGKKDG